MFRRPKNLHEPRNRSLEPQPRNVVFSYHANRSIREGSASVGRLSPEDETLPKRQRRKAWLRRLPAVAALGVIGLCCVIILSLTPNVKVISVTSTNSSNQLFLHDTSTYQKAAQKLFAASGFNRNKLTVDASGIAARMRAEFPELQSVSIALPLIGHRPLVYVQPSNPVMFLRTQGGGVFILDKAGRALVGGSEAASHLAQFQIPIVQDESGLRVQTGDLALPSDNVDFIAQVVGQLQAHSLQIETLRLPSAASELVIKLQGSPYTIRFNMHGDPKQQAGSFLAVKQYLEGQHSTPGRYIDVRVPERAYYL